MTTSQLLQSFSSNQLNCNEQKGDSSEAIIENLVAASSSQNYDPAQLVSNYPIDPKLLEHENPNNCADLAPQLPLDKYRLNVDQCPTIVRRKPQEKVCYLQQVAVRYLKPPQPPKAGDIVIQQLPHKQVAPAPALVVRQAPPKAATPPPVIIREAPPPPPCPLPGRTVCVPGKVVPPPARKVVVERLPQIPCKPPQVFIERWLPYGQQIQRVVYKPAAPPCCIPDPKNVVIQWESPECDIRKEFKNLGCIQADPQEYINRYGSSLVRSDQLPEMAVKYGNQGGFQLAATHRAPDHPLLEGDLHALQFIDLDQVGLGYYKDKFGSNHASSSSNNNCNGNGHSASYSSSDAVAAAATASYSQFQAAQNSSNGSSFSSAEADCYASSTTAVHTSSDHVYQSESQHQAISESYNQNFDCPDQQSVDSTEYLNFSSEQYPC